MDSWASCITHLQFRSSIENIRFRITIVMGTNIKVIVLTPFLSLSVSVLHSIFLSLFYWCTPYVMMKKIAVWERAKHGLRERKAWRWRREIEILKNSDKMGLMSWLSVYGLTTVEFPRVKCFKFQLACHFLHPWFISDASWNLCYHLQHLPFLIFSNPS